MEKKHVQLNIDAKRVEKKVSNTLFGLFLEDINFSCDGGLNANMVNNHSFDGVYMRNKRVNLFTMMTKITRKINTMEDRLRYWDCIGGSIKSLNTNPAAPNSWYARVHSNGSCQIENLGYQGNTSDSRNCSMSIVEGKDYAFSCFIRNSDFKGEVKVYAADKNGHKLTEEKALVLKENWSVSEVKLMGMKTCYGKLILKFEGNGAVDLDCISFMDMDTWGNDNPKWSQGKLRKDLVEALCDLKPRFMRFPGGCIVEGIENGNEYQWKDGVGPIINRKPNFNLWATDLPGGGYVQSLQVGFYEYFLLCEDLNMEPLPIVWAGMNCQLRQRGKLNIDSKEFQERVVQNAIELIEYANGEPETSKWAKLRAEAGHPEPFNLKYIGLGNENHSEDYINRFEIMKKAIDKNYPGMVCIMSSGAFPKGKAFEYSWNKANEKFPDVYIDEHFYKKPEWVIESHTRYDHYKRDTAKVFLGEYAAYPLISKKNPPNFYYSALAEAAFLTGIERNSDVVAMTCYAPLFSKIDGNQWRHNLINFNSSHVLKTCNYYVQQMYGESVGDKVVKIVSDLPKGIFASATATDEKLVLKLVNTNQETAVASLKLSNITGSKASIKYLQCDNLNEVNSLGYHGEPKYNIEPRLKELSLKDGTIDMEMEKYSFYVITVNI